MNKKQELKSLADEQGLAVHFENNRCYLVVVDTEKLTIKGHIYSGSVRQCIAFLYGLYNYKKYAEA